MKAADVIATLRKHETQLRARGIRHAALFGSTARGSETASSDIDIMIDIDPDAARDIYSYVGLKTFVAELFNGPVDVVDRDALRANLRPPAEDEAIYAF